MASRYIPAKFQFFDDTGAVLAGGSLTFYGSGTVILKDVFADENGTALANPVTLDGAGKMPNIWLEGAYKVVIKDSDAVQLSEADPVTGSTSGTNAFDDWNAVSVYSQYDIARGSDGVLNISISGANQANDPGTFSALWERINFVRSWNTNETYQIGDVIKLPVSIYSDDAGRLFRSGAADNIGNDPLNEPEWVEIGAAADSALDQLEDNAFLPVEINGTDISGTAFTSFSSALNLVAGGSINTTAGSTTLGTTTIGLVTATSNINMGTGAINMGTGNLAVESGGNITLDGGEFQVASGGLIEIDTFDMFGFGTGVLIDGANSIIETSQQTNATASHNEFYNSSGFVGSIQTNTSATSYNTSSDPRLKSEFVEMDTKLALEYVKEAHDKKWSGVFCFKVDPKTPVAGYNAHALIDNQPGFGGSEGVGARDMEIGSTYLDGEAEVTVTPACVDQSKRVPLLEAAIVELMKRIEVLEGS